MGQTGVIEVPSRRGYVPDDQGLQFELWALTCYFPPQPGITREPSRIAERRSVLIVSDSMFRGMVRFAWPSILKVDLSVNGGARIGSLCRILAASCRSQEPGLAVLHGGINDIGSRGETTGAVEEVLRVFKLASDRLRTQYPRVKFVLSAICQTRSIDINRRLALANSALREICDGSGWHFLSNDHNAISRIKST